MADSAESENWIPKLNARNLFLTFIVIFILPGLILTILFLADTSPEVSKNCDKDHYPNVFVALIYMIFSALLIPYFLYRASMATGKTADTLTIILRVVLVFANIGGLVTAAIFLAAYDSETSCAYNWYSSSGDFVTSESLALMDALLVPSIFLLILSIWPISFLFVYLVFLIPVVIFSMFYTFIVGKCNRLDYYMGYYSTGKFLLAEAAPTQDQPSQSCGDCPAVPAPNINKKSAFGILSLFGLPATVIGIACLAAFWVSDVNPADLCTNNLYASIMLCVIAQLLFCIILFLYLTTKEPPAYLRFLLVVGMIGGLAIGASALAAADQDNLCGYSYYSYSGVDDTDPRHEIVATGSMLTGAMLLLHSLFPLSWFFLLLFGGMVLSIFFGFYACFTCSCNHCLYYWSYEWLWKEEDRLLVEKNEESLAAATVTVA